MSPRSSGLALSLQIVRHHSLQPGIYILIHAGCLLVCFLPACLFVCLSVLLSSVSCSCACVVVIVIQVVIVIIFIILVVVGMVGNVVVVGLLLLLFKLL